MSRTKHEKQVATACAGRAAREAACSPPAGGCPCPAAASRSPGRMRQVKRWQQAPGPARANREREHRVDGRPGRRARPLPQQRQLRGASGTPAAGGWRLDRKGARARALKYRRGEGEILIVNHDGRGWWDPQGAAKGDVFDLVQHLDPSLNFGQVRQVLRRFVGVAPTFPDTLRRKATPRPNRPLAERWAGRTRLRPGSPAWRYLAETRGLPDGVLAHRRLAGCGPGGLVRQHLVRTPPGWRRLPCGGPGTGLQGSLAGGRKALFRFGGAEQPKAPVAQAAGMAAERGERCDASPWPKHRSTRSASIERCRGDTLYLATGGGMGPDTLAATRACCTPPPLSRVRCCAAPWTPNPPENATPPGTPNWRPPRVSASNVWRRPEARIGTTLCEREGETMTPDRAWILLPSDHRLDLLAPDPETWTDEDLAIGLSRTFRRAGYSAWDPPLSVAQHSLTVLALRARMPGPSTDLGLTLELLDTDLLTLPVGMRPWKPWPPRVPRRTSRSGSGCFRRREKARTGGAITRPPILHDLTPLRAEAATLQGPVLVLAGAGTGWSMSW